jgi:hypothetical protein
MVISGMETRTMRRRPFSLDGSKGTDQIGVGAHQAHLKGSKIAEAVQCEECHIVPKNVYDPGRFAEDPNDSHAKVVFGTLASHANLAPAWDRSTCSNQGTDGKCNQIDQPHGVDPKPNKKRGERD